MELEARVFSTDTGDYLVGPAGRWGRIYTAHHDAVTAEVGLRDLRLMMMADHQGDIRLLGDQAGQVCAARPVVERHLVPVRAKQAESARSMDWHEIAAASDGATS